MINAIKYEWLHMSYQGAFLMQWTASITGIAMCQSAVSFVGS